MLVVSKKKSAASEFIDEVVYRAKGFFSRFKTVKVDTFDYIFTFYTRRYGYICFHGPSRNAGWFLYFSPDAKVESSTFYRGSDRGERVRAMIRKELVSHNWIYKYSNSPYIPRSELAQVYDCVNDLNEDLKAVFEGYKVFGYSSDTLR